MHDIQTQDDVKHLIDKFYNKVRKDDAIGFIFSDIIGDHWDRHLPTMYKFWNMVLLSIPGYEGYPTRTHIEIHKKIPLKQEHFERWLALWSETVDALFAGEIATQAKDKAKLMADLISIKTSGNSIQ